MSTARTGRGMLGLFSHGIAIQALLSAANLAVSLVLIRFATDAQYGYYVLVASGLLLGTALQGAFLQPPMVLRMTHEDAAGRAALIGSVTHAHRRILGVLALAAALAVGAVALARLPGPLVALVAAAAVAGLAALYREYFRMVLLACHRPAAVLRADVVFVAILVAGAWLATRTTAADVVAVAALALAGAVAGVVLAFLLRREESPRMPASSAGVLRAMVPIGAWSALGAATHWLFSQGYNYLAAADLDVTAVAALAATRLLLMPVNLVSTGIGSLMLPAASRWLQDHGQAAVLRRLLTVAGGVALVALAYLAVLWTFRDFVFTDILGKDFEGRDTLLLLWSIVFMVTAFRDQLLYLPGALGRFRPMALVALGAAALGLGVTQWALQRYGVVGGPIGVLAGEIANLAGLVALGLHRGPRGRPAVGVAR